MILAVAATTFEMQPFVAHCALPADRLVHCLSGVGPVEAAVSMMRLLARYEHRVRAVVNFGIGGAYVPAEGSGGAAILDLCLARREVLGDFGVVTGEHIEPFSDSSLAGPWQFDLDAALLEQAGRSLAHQSITFSAGTFVTVNAASGTAARGDSLHRRFSGLCENMEGAAIARACQHYVLPLLEVRAISNLVEDRPGTPWQLAQACDHAARAAALIVTDLQEGA